MRTPKNLIPTELLKSAAEARRVAHQFQLPEELRQTMAEAARVAGQFQLPPAFLSASAEAQRIVDQIQASLAMRELARIAEQTQTLVDQMLPPLAVTQQLLETIALASRPPAMDKLFAELERIQESVAESVAPLMAAIETFAGSASFGRMLESVRAFEETQREFLELVRTRAEAMARRGWTLPANIPFSALMRLLRVPDDGLDDAFRDLYELNDGAETAALWAELIGSDVLVEQRSLLLELQPVFEAGNYRVVGMCLFPVFEATMRSVLGNETYRAQPRRERLTALSRAGASDDVNRSVAVSVATFANVIYASYHPGETAPALLNRHFALHGAGARESMLDCLRLLQGCSTFLWIERLLRTEAEGETTPG